MGMNCGAVIGRNAIGNSGVEYCADLVSQRMTVLVGAADIHSTCRVVFTEASLRYEVRFEPHANSQGEHLFAAVNGH